MEVSRAITLSHFEDILENLGREAELATKTLGTGLTEIRKYDFNQFGTFYSGIFSVSIALERICKLVLLVDYYLSHDNQFPTNNKYLRKISHNIGDLIEKTREINQSRNLDVDELIFNDHLIISLIKFLTDFGQNHGRYYNLDVIQGEQRNTKEPLARWEQEINGVIVERHFKMTKKLTELASAYKTMTPISINLISEDGRKITSQDDMINHVVQMECKQKYSFLYLYQISRFTIQVFRKLEPFQLGGLFAIYCNEDSYAIKKKAWNPYKP